MFVLMVHAEEKPAQRPDKLPRCGWTYRSQVCVYWVVIVDWLYYHYCGFIKVEGSTIFSTYNYDYISLVLLISFSSLFVCHRVSFLSPLS